MIKTRLIKLFLKLCHRVQVHGMENYSQAGDKVLYVINPSSLLDPILLSLFLPCKMTYIVDKTHVNKWYTRPMYANANIIEVDFSTPNSTKEIIKVLEEHSHCMVFHDSQFYTDPELMKVYEATALIATKTQATLLPIRIDGVQYSFFSYFRHKARLQFFPKITISILEPQKLDNSSEKSSKENRKILASKLHSLISELRYRSSNIDKSLVDKLVEAIKLHGKDKVIAEDQDRITMSYKTLYLKAQALGASLHKEFPKERVVGFLLPNSLAGIVTFFALHFYKHIPAMLNFSAGITPVISACQTALVKTVITSRKFIKLAELTALEEAIKKEEIRIIYLEDIAKNMSTSIKIKAFLKTLFLCKSKLNPNDPCAVLFTSGSEGLPKAVLMSHRNVIANHEQLLSIISITSADRFFNCLPMFHTFGLSVCTLLPILEGIRVFMYPSPLHYRIVPQLFYESLSTFFCSTETFLTGYARYGKPFDFFNVRYIIAGAEKLRESTIKTYKDNFNMTIFEGYGATETSPVLSVNTPANIRKDTVGKILPGIEYKLKEIEGIENGGSLCVRGDNIMLGYMYHNNPGVLEPPLDGWHDLGDIVEVDSEGFISIKGRAKRFAKIGGEMVSLTAVEQAIEPLLSGIPYGIVAIPDDKKGEILVLLVEKNDISTSKIASFFAQKGLPPLWTPRKILNLKSAPVLGSGKFDYISAKKIALVEKS